MRHHHAHRTFGRSRDQREALLRGLAISLVHKGRIVTTLPKAKELRPFVERLVTLAKTDTASQRRLVNARLGNNDLATARLFGHIAPKHADRPGGYTRIMKTHIRMSDAAPMAIIEFVA